MRREAISMPAHSASPKIAAATITAATLFLMEGASAWNRVFTASS